LASSFICQVALVIAACSKLSSCSSASYRCSSYVVKIGTTCHINKSSSLAFISTDETPTSSEISVAKENRLSGESYS